MQYEDDYSIQPNEEVEENSTSELEEEDIKPVNFGKKPVGLLLFLAIILIMIVSGLLSRCSLAKETKSYVEGSELSSVQQSVEIEVPSNSVEGSSKISESSTSNMDSSSALPENINSSESAEVKSEVNNPQPENTVVPTEVPSLVVTEAPTVIEGNVIKEETVEEIVSSDFELVQTEPALGAEIVTSGIVTGMSMYKVGNSYTYGVNILIVTGNDTNVECCYFCPRRTYSALTVGDALTVTYQMDSRGNVSVATISK